jgi:hypothetical protein
MWRKPKRFSVLTAVIVAIPAVASAGIDLPPAPPGDFWSHTRCTNGIRQVAEGGIMERLTGLTLPQCLERCSRTTGCVGVYYRDHFSYSSGALLDSECNLIRHYVGRTIAEPRTEPTKTSDLGTRHMVCFFDWRYRDDPWRRIDAGPSLPDRYREEFRPGSGSPGGAPANRYKP